MVSSHRERRAASWGGTTRSIIEHRVLKQENRSPKLEVIGGQRGRVAGCTGHEQELDKTLHKSERGEVEE